MGIENPPDNELRRDRPVPLVFLETEGDVERSLLPKSVELPPEAEGDRTARVAGPVLDPKPEVLAVADRGDVGAEVERQLGAVHQRVDDRQRTQLGFGEVLVGMLGERRREGVDIARFDREARCRAVAPEPREMIRTGGEPAVEVERARRSTGSLPLAFATRDQDDGAVVSLDEPRRDDPDHAFVPVLSREHVGVLTPFWLGPRLDLFDRFPQDPLFDRLPVAVELVEAVGEPARLLPILGEEQSERGLRVAEPPGGIQPRSQPEADGSRVDRSGIDAGDLHELAQPRLLRARKGAEAGDRQAAVFVHERDDVRNRRNRDEIEVPVQPFAALPQEGLAELEDDSRAAKVAERIGGVAVRPDQRAGRQRLGWPVVVGHDDFEPELARRGHFRRSRDSTVDREDEPAAVRGEPRECLLLYPVSLVEPTRQVPLDIGAEPAQDQDGKGGRADAVGVVVTVDTDAAAGGDRAAGRLTSGGHVAELEWVMSGQRTFEESPGAVDVVVAAASKHGRRCLAEPEPPREPSNGLA